jgi:DNA mismatch repair protein MutS
MKKSIVRRAISSLSISLILGSFCKLVAAQQPYNTNLTHAIASYYISSLSNHKSKTIQISSVKKKPQEVWRAELPLLSEQEKVSIIFNNIFSKSSIINSLQIQQEHILNNYAWHDLKLFYGSHANPTSHLLNQIDRTISVIGRSTLAVLLAMPTSNIKELHARQRIVQLLLEKECVFKQLTKIYHDYLSIEGRLLSLWSKHDPLFNRFYKSFIQQTLYFNIKNSDRYNKASNALELRKRLYFDSILALHGTSISFQSYYLFKVLTDQATFKKIISANHPMWIRILAWYPLATIPIEILSIKKHYDNWATPLKYVATRLADIQQWLLTAKNINAIVAGCPELESVYGKHLVNLRMLLSQPSTTEEGKLVNQLSDLPFKKWSVFFNNNGKLLQTYKLFVKHKDKLTDALYEFGKLDAFLSIACLLQETQNSKKQPAYTFTQFLKRTDKHKPCIALVDMWNPFLNPKKAVTNTIIMDDEHKVRNIILTGPNAGGKSVFISGMAISLLLSQTLGIAPANSATITPFNKINTYLDVSSDIAEGKSLFVAEVERAQQQLNTIAALQNNEFSFSVMDEIFSGTNPKEGEAAAYSIAHYLSKYTNNLSVIATHFPKLTLLPERVQAGMFVNYKVSVGREGEKNKLLYTYKIELGKSNQTIALDILEEQGYDIKMLEEAREILAHPDHYQATF